MGDSLDPSPLSRLTELLRPDWSRTVAARRTLAGALVVLAAVAAWRDDPRADHADVVVTARDLTPGIELTADDIRLETRTASTIPDGSRTDVDSVVGATLAGPARRGEVAHRRAPAGAAVGGVGGGTGRAHRSAPPGRRRPGRSRQTRRRRRHRGGAHHRRIPGRKPVLIATDAVVVLVSAKGNGASAGGAGRVVLVALPAAAAKTVAGVALVQTITLTLH